MTGRDVVLRERAAFLAGVWQGHIDRLVCEKHQRTEGMYTWDAEAQKALLDTTEKSVAQALYPLPKVTRTRVVQDVSPDGVRNEWKYENGTLWHKVAHGDGWHTAENNSGMYINTPRVKLLANLIAQPTETVDA